MIKIKIFIPLIIMFSLLISGWLFGINDYLSLEYLKNNQKIIEYYIVNHYFLSLLAYRTTYILVIAFSIPVATLLSVIGGLFFGQLTAIVAVAVSATIGASIFFQFVTVASNKLISSHIECSILKMKNGFQKNAFSYLLTLRLLPFFPFAIVNIASAVFQVPLRTFAIGTFLGIIPGSFVYVSIGATLSEVLHEQNYPPNIIVDGRFFIVLFLLAILSLLPVIFKHFKKNLTTCLIKCNSK